MGYRVWGFVLVVLGILALLQGIGLYHFGLAFWPVILVLAGGSLVWASFSCGKSMWMLLGLGLWIGGIGLFEILANAGVTAMAGEQIFRHGWPLLLVALGISLMLGDRTPFSGRHCFKSGQESRRKDKSSGTRWHHVGELYHGREPWVLDGDFDLQHGIGEIVLDLSTAAISEGSHQVHVSASIGELLIRVPDHVNAVVEGSVSLGELEIFGENRSGLGGLSLQQEIFSKDSPVKLQIKARLGIGSLKVVRVPAAPGLSH
ncbi:MAG TPA: LiaF-related protein [Bacillota bacterium]|nr:LiaF-related protein [Bacillota bacterium]